MILESTKSGAPVTTSEQQAVPVAQERPTQTDCECEVCHANVAAWEGVMCCHCVTVPWKRLASHPCKSGEGAGAVIIPADIAEHVRSLGRVEWAQTHAHDAEGHGRHVADSVRITAANFGQDGDQHMHGLWLAGTETVLCHTGTSPNAPKTTQALVGAWNWLVDQASGVPAIDATQTREAEGRVFRGESENDRIKRVTEQATASSISAVGQAMMARFGPCEHQWSYAPTVGNLSCIKCQERREYDHPETIAYRAALNARGGA